MNHLDEWTAENLPSFWEAVLGMFAGFLIVSQLLGGGPEALLAGMILGPFLGWGATIALHQWLVAKPRREEDERRVARIRAKRGRR